MLLRCHCERDSLRNIQVSSRVIAFAALVEADIAGITAGAGDDDIRFLLHGNALDIEDGFSAGTPCFIPVAADHTADFTVGIDDGVDEEARVDFAAGFDHVIVKRVVVDHEGAGLRIDAMAKFIG